MSSKRERIEAAIKGEVADRAPVALWRHFPVDDQTPESLAESTARFQERFDFDLVKVTPASSYCLRDWGVIDEWRGDPEGTRSYTKRIIESPEDWGRLAVLDPRSGQLGDQLTCLGLLRERFGRDVPMIQTIFNPLAQAKNLAGGARLLEHLHQAPQLVERGLRVIRDTTLAFVEALQSIQIDGIFFAVQHASFHYFDGPTYARYGEAYDMPILEAANPWWLNVLHLHGEAVMFDIALRYPVQVVNWHDLETPPSLSEGAQQFKGAVCGGTRRDTLALGTPEDIRAETQAALDTTGSKGVIISTGCVIPIVTPEGNIRSVRNAVECA
ncbi:MAG: uroporphyrinogen decarboxylase [Anaerolineales bacterium]|nr:MAG: uroporphyrinogen decarboxylase [Anaerolineales bacterium]